MKRVMMLLLFAVLIVAARGKNESQTAPGKYKDWGEAEIDEIEIVKTFALSGYDTVAVMPFDTSKVKVDDDKKAVVIQGALDGYTAVFVEGLRDELKNKAKVEIADKAPKTAKTLVLRGTVEEIDPGSRAKRYVAGFGAGAARNKVSIEIADAKSGEVLVRFTQAHRSAGTFKFAGGSDAQVLRDGTRAMGEDTAQVLMSF